MPDTSHYCSECGMPTQHRPLVDWQRRPERRGWDVFIYTPDEPIRGMVVFVPDRPGIPWGYSSPANLLENTDVQASRLFDGPTRPVMGEPPNG